ncbi:2-dehydro-3-deoxygluconokinase [Paenibacillus yonginensis]|uniref:2-dehydro-3-deoxygluconokinase n=1 Tax=Paenibacillus yonginensis TaxID=1462996 RepID=A0A1B1MVN2_9BACL|nr:sugar kinase [Paenibacillus yonginensis]ANS73243.1 2-dehydro-3-deoxygluconokinase [Paenibacillus yonginensis]
MPKTVAAFGEVMMRLQVPGHELLAQSDTLKYSFSGTGVNVISALSQFGHKGYLISRLPDNPLGDAAAAYLRKLGIDTSKILRGGSYLGMYFLENGFGIRPSRVTYSNRQESSFNTAPDGVYPFEQTAGEMDAVHFCGITLAMNDGVRRSMKEFAGQVKTQGGLVIFDCNYRPGLWGASGGYAFARPHYEAMLQLADVVFMNEQDALHVLGMTSASGKEQRQELLEELIPAAAERYGLRTVAGTHRNLLEDGRHSLRGYIYRDGRFSYSDVLVFPVHDRIGAGDAFASGIIHGELEGFAPERTVAFAAAAGMLAHTVTGDTPMASEAEVLRAMAQGLRDVER